MTKQSFISRIFTSEFHPAVLPRSIAAGVLMFLLEVIIVISFTAFIFSGPLAPWLPYGIGLLIAGDAVICAVVALLSSYAGSIAVEQDVPSAVLAVAIASLLATLPSTTTPAQQFATVVVMIVGTTLITGLIFSLLGALKLGKLVRFLPYPVMGGFLAGTGYLLTMGGINVMLDTGIKLQMLMPAHWLRWVPGLALGVLMYYIVERFKNPLALPSAFAFGLLAFYVIAWLTHTTLTQLSLDGWLLGPFPSGSLWQFPLSPAIQSQVNWLAILRQWPQLATISLVSVIALLLNASGIELIIKRDIDLNRELVVAGVANLASGLVGGTVGYHAISLSGLSQSVSGGKRLPGLLVALLLGIVGVIGPSLFGFIPRMVLAALLVYLGLGLLVEWVYHAWFRFPRVDFLILLSILIVIALSGFLEGVGLGLVLAIVLFVVSYSQIPFTRFAVSGKTFRSRVQRSQREQEILNTHGEALYVLKLQGFLFFGTADRLFEQIRDRAQSTQSETLRYVVLDLAQVSGLDSTALLSFEKLLRLAREQRITLVIAGLSSRMREQFSKGGFASGPDELQFLADLDHAVEWCENQIISMHQSGHPPEPSLQEDLAGILPENAGVQKLIEYMERTEIEPGAYLIRQGDLADTLIFVESGQVTAQLEVKGKAAVRLETMRGGSTVGEIGFYLGVSRTAAVVADESSIIYSLSRQKLEQIEKADPAVAYALHRIIVHLLGQRVRHLTRVVDALER